MSAREVPPCFVCAFPVRAFAQVKQFPCISRTRPGTRCEPSSKRVVVHCAVLQGSSKASRSFRSGEDAFTTFRRDIAQYQLLSPSEERELTTRVARLREHSKARDRIIESDGPVAATDEVVADSLGLSLGELLKERSEGLAARDALVAANLRLVVKLAREVQKKHISEGSRSGVPLLDLVQEGTLGLLQAADKFDPARGTKFSSFAYVTIKRRCERALMEQYLSVRVPNYIIQASKQLRAARAEYFAKTGSWPSDTELARMLPGISIAAVRRAERLMDNSLSLDTPYTSGGPNSGTSTVTIGEFLADEEKQSPELDLERESNAELVRQAVRKVLKPRDAKILILRFGLDGGEPELNKSIAEVFDISEARVNQIVGASLLKLKRNKPELAYLMS